MRKTFTFIALAMVATMSMVSCKNTKNAEPTPEEIEAQKVALADSVLAKIDALTDKYIEANEHGINFRNFELTDKEKAKKPDYLLDLSVANTLVTKRQKVNALAIYSMEYIVRELFGMPLDEAKEVIAKLSADLNNPIEVESSISDDSKLTEKIKQMYNSCKENGELAYFWQFQTACIREIDYLLSKDTDLFFAHISEEENNSYGLTWRSYREAIMTLAPYDEEMALIQETFGTWVTLDLDDIKANYYSSIEQTKESFRNNTMNKIEKRNALLQ